MLLKALLLACFVVIIHEVVAERGCPDPEEIAPCTCVEEIYTDLRCVGLNEIETLKRIFKNSKGYHFSRFFLINSTLQFIPHEVFDKVEIKTLDFNKVAFVRTFDITSENKGVETFRLSNVRILGGWDWSKLSHFSHLKSLTIRDIPLRISNDFRPNIRNLKTLKFLGCGIKKLRDNEFQEFKELNVFFVNRDKITTIKRTMFARPSKLKGLSFASNKLTSIPEDMFVDMPILGFLELDDNQLTSLPVDTYRPVIDRLIFFKLYGNPLRCDCEIQWLTFKKNMDFLTGKCESPQKFNGKDLAALKPQDFRC